ncbi:OadG family protein [bacterium]|nr:OadG family protein [bacterium]
MFNSALELTVVGMSVVFAFLVIMVCTMQIMSYIVHKYFPEEKYEAQTALVSEDNALIAAIAVAVKNRK